jgi:hypothetical protein
LEGTACWAIALNSNWLKRIQFGRQKLERIGKIKVQQLPRYDKIARDFFSRLRTQTGQSLGALAGQ